MSRNWSNDILGILRGAQAVINASIRLQQVQCKQIWKNSSVKSFGEETSKNLRQSLSQDVIQQDLARNVMEMLQRTSMVYEGVKSYVMYSGGIEMSPKLSESELPELEEFDIDAFKLLSELPHEKAGATTIPDTTSVAKDQTGRKTDRSPETKSASVTDKIARTVSESKPGIEPQPPPAKMRQNPKQTLSATSKQRKVPSSRLARMVSFGSLAAGLGIGAVAEVTRRSLGLTNEDPKQSGALDNVLLSEANAERIVNTLCKVRGAALKLGQILSIQDNTIISPTLQRAFERVRQSADFMPTWQVEKVLESELGKDWRSIMKTFDPKPFAAASIGQVHLAVLPDNTEVAMKIQYPGVAKGIESDIDNLVGIMKVWNVFPESLFIDNLVQVAKRELAWEVDYERERECTQKFRQLLEPYPDYYVPNVVEQLCTRQVFTTELVEGIPVDKCVDLDEQSRHHIGTLVMELCLKELFEFQYMQTDPNWSNFFYNPDTNKLILLDFGASRPYSKEFLDIYIEIIRGAADDDRDLVLTKSREIGFLTGYESKIMEEAHIDAVMILGEVFQKSEPFNFGAQNTTKRIQSLVPTMLKHRLCPPPEEIYSLHRKLSGIFLLLAKLNVKFECKSMFDKVYNMYRSRYR